jgi:hypothetical protein
MTLWLSARTGDKADQAVLLAAVDLLDGKNFI